MVCLVSPSPETFASSFLGYLDCQAVSLGSAGFMALSTPGSSVSLLLSALLTILVALAGYRILFGETTSVVRDGVLGFLKIGVVLAFATSWPAYRTVIFDVVLRSPADLAGEIGRPAGLPGANGGLAMRLDGVDRSFRILSIYGPGVPTREQVEQAEGIAPPLFANFDSFALGSSRVIFLVGSLGAFAIVRLSAAFLLALGPLFVTFLLFSVTRGIAFGWLRGLLGAALGGAAIAIVLGVELTLLEPWLSELAARRASGIATPGIPTALLATAIIFAVATAGLLALATRIALGLELPSVSVLREGSRLIPVSGPARPLPTYQTSAEAGVGSRTRAMTIADSIISAQRREEQNASLGISGSVMAHGTSEMFQTRHGSTIGSLSEQASARRTSLRRSRSASARDRSS